MAIVHVGIDLAKNVFALHGVSESGAVVLRQPKVSRSNLGEAAAALPTWTIGIEACTGAHHWARRVAAHGHTVKLVAPDAADAAAICEAVQRPNMRFAHHALKNWGPRE